MSNSTFHRAPRHWSAMLGPALVLSGLVPFGTTPARGGTCDHLFGGAEGELFQEHVDEVTGTFRVRGNEVTILPEATSDYALRTELIEGARSFVHTYTLLIENNETGIATAKQLANKALLDGVEANVILHPLSQAFSSSVAITAALRLVGVRVHAYWAENAPNLFEFLVLGPHKKSLLVDSEAYGLEGIVGGRNIGDNYFGNVPDPLPDTFSNIWRDTDIHVRGPILYDLMDDYIRRFNEQSRGGETTGCAEGEDPCRYYPSVRTEDPAADVELRMLQNEPDDNGGEGLFEINTMYEELLGQARESIDIETPYFIPQPPLLDALYDALARGVRVRLLTNSVGSNDLGAPLFYASSYYWPDLLDAGMEIYMWDVAKLEGYDDIYRTMHSKVVIVDECVFQPGSWNFDGRAYSWENEYAFPITDAPLASEAHTMYESDLLTDGVVMIDAQWFAENFTEEDYAKAFFFALFSPLL